MLDRWSGSLSATTNATLPVGGVGGVNFIMFPKHTILNESPLFKLPIRSLKPSHNSHLDSLQRWDNSIGSGPCTEVRMHEILIEIVYNIYICYLYSAPQNQQVPG